MPVAMESSLEGIDCKCLCTTRKTNMIAFILKVNVVYWIVVRLKPEHHPICAPLEDIPKTNIYTYIDFNHSDLQSTFHKQEMVEKN